MIIQRKIQPIRWPHLAPTQEAKINLNCCTNCTEFVIVLLPYFRLTVEWSLQNGAIVDKMETRETPI